MSKNLFYYTNSQTICTSNTEEVTNVFQSVYKNAAIFFMEHHLFKKKTVFFV